VNKCKITSSHIFGLYEKSNFFGSSATLFSEDELIYAFDRNVTSDYTETSFIFSTSSNDGINKFLTFAGETYLGLDMYIDWIKITRLPKPGELVQLVDFEDEQNPTFVDGTTDYSFEKDDMGNRYIRIYSDDSTDEYPHFVFRTDAELKPNTDYTVSFQYKSSENWFDRAFFLAGSGINNWQFRYKPHWTQDSTVVNRTNLIGNELTDSAGYPYRTGKLAINKSTQWKKAEVTFNSGNIVDGAFKYLSFLVQFGPTGTKVREVAIDDIMLIEHNKNLQSGYVLCNMGYGAEPYYLNGSKVSALLESDGYLFNGWFNNKAKTEKFVSDDETALPYMIYADYDIDLNCDGLSNLVDLIRLKKSASGEITDYVVATDVNSDGSVNALDIANFKYYLLY